MNTQSKRFNRYQVFRLKIKEIGSKFASAATCPIAGIHDTRRAEREFDKLPKKWQERIGRRVDAAINNYHRPVVKGNDGQEYSCYDMDRAMMGYSY